MGLIATAFQPMVGSRPKFPVMGTLTGPGQPATDFQGYSRAYMRNEVVYACVEMLASSAAEPHIIGRRWQRSSPSARSEIRAAENRLLGIGLSRRQAWDRLIRNGFFQELSDHALVRLLNAPNPFLSRGQMWGTVVMDRALAGNAYLYKARLSRGPATGAIMELWRLRPDRVRVIPDTRKFISHYEYRTDEGIERIPPEDIIHFRTRSPLGDHYGMPPLMPIAERVDIDDYMRGFLRSFFEAGGTGPASILTSKASLTQEQKTEIGDKFEHRFNNPRGFHRLLVLDNTESTYTQLGLNRGLRDALPKEIDEVTESRIAAAFGIPPDLLGLLVGMQTSSYANRRVSWAVFWDLTMIPLLSDLDDSLNLSIVPDFERIDEVMFDISDIRALSEDVDKLHERYRKDLAAGGISLEEFREATGRDPAIKEGTFYVPMNISLITKGANPALEAPEPPAPPEPEPEPEVEEAAEAPEVAAIVARPRCPDCERRVGANVQAGASLSCPKCRRYFTVASNGSD